MPRREREVIILEFRDDNDNLRGEWRFATSDSVSVFNGFFYPKDLAVIARIVRMLHQTYPRKPK